MIQAFGLPSLVSYSWQTATPNTEEIKKIVTIKTVTRYEIVHP